MKGFDPVNRRLLVSFATVLSRPKASSTAKRVLPVGTFWLGRTQIALFESFVVRQLKVSSTGVALRLATRGLRDTLTRQIGATQSGRYPVRTSAR